jgi:serine/threonine protein kinase
VFLGTYHGDKVAIKRFKKRQNNKMDIKSFLSEVEMLQGLRHKNIVLYMGVCIDNSGYMIVTEYMERGSLFDLIHTEKRVEKIPLTQLIEMIKDIAEAMVFIHSKDILHCDLKSKNILVDENLNLKIADFGLSRIKNPLSKI